MNKDKNNTIIYHSVEDKYFFIMIKSRYANLFNHTNCNDKKIFKKIF